MNKSRKSKGQELMDELSEFARNRTDPSTVDTALQRVEYQVERLTRAVVRLLREKDMTIINLNAELADCRQRNAARAQCGDVVFSEPDLERARSELKQFELEIQIESLRGELERANEELERFRDKELVNVTPPELQKAERDPFAYRSVLVKVVNDKTLVIANEAPIPRRSIRYSWSQS